MEKIGDKKKYYKKIILFIFIIAMFFTLISYALSDVTVEYLKENGVQYIFFKINHNLANVAYKYFGYGYHVTIYDNDNNEIGYKFLTNEEFSPKMIGGVETVKIKIEDLYNKTDVETKYYYRQDCTIWLNGRLGIRVNGTLKFLYDSLDGTPEKGLNSLPTGYETYDGQTVPLNKDGFGIRNGIEHEYGFSWSWVTHENLKQHFGIHFTLDPIFKYDGYEVQYKEVATEKTVSSEKPLTNFNEARPITEYPVSVNGYEYSGYYEIKKVDSKGKPVTPPPKLMTQGDSATVNLQQTASIYTIIFYYNKIDPSQIGKPVNIDIEYRESTTDGRELKDSTTILGGELSSFNVSSAKIDDYECKGHFVMGQATEYFYNTNANFIIGKENYSKPVNGRLKVIFIYEEKEYISIPKCTPIVDGGADVVNIYMKKKDFENAIDISVNDAVFRINDFGCGKDKDGKKVDGSHEFHHFDLYIEGYGDSHDNKSKEVRKSLVVPKSKFIQSSTNVYTTNIDLTFAAFCSCFDGKADKNGNYGMEINNNILTININIVENKPPVALYDYYTERKFYDGSIQKLKKAYTGRETIIENKANDPNGIKDIKYIKYTLTDSKNVQYYVNLLMLGNGTYFLDNNNINAKNLIFNGARDDGSLKLKFLTVETWTISQYVEDLDGLNDIYTNTITPEILDLRPTAVINDTIIYRYPVGMAFNSKQNRVVKYSSDSSYVALFLQYDDVKINHNRDCWEIIPLDGQNIDTIYFENKTGLNIIKENNTIQIKYSILNNTKLQFSQTGKYKIRLQVSDTNGNVSEWTERIITINKDLNPIITANINATYYRNANGIANIIIKDIVPSSPDNDYVVMEDTDTIKYKYDSNNNGSFEDEVAKNISLTVSGSKYGTILTTSQLGKYQFIINVRETFGQEYLSEYITDNDYKKAGAILETEIDNIAPDVTLFEIWTTDN